MPLEQFEEISKIFSIDLCVIINHLREILSSFEIGMGCDAEMLFDAIQFRLIHDNSKGFIKYIGLITFFKDRVEICDWRTPCSCTDERRIYHYDNPDEFDKELKADIVKTFCMPSLSNANIFASYLNTNIIE